MTPVRELESITLSNNYNKESIYSKASKIFFISILCNRP